MESGIYVTSSRPAAFGTLLGANGQLTLIVIYFGPKWGYNLIGHNALAFGCRGALEADAKALRLMWTNPNSSLKH